MTVEVFFCYARKDEQLLNNLKAHFQPMLREGLVALWHDRNISAGANWKQETDEHLNTAQIILLLVSRDFVASDYCYSIEMNRALERHERREARAIPIILRPTDWQQTLLGRLQALPKDGKPVTSWRDRDEAYVDITKGLRKIIEEMDTQSTALPLTEHQTKPEVHGYQNDKDGQLDTVHASATTNSVSEEALAKLREEMQRQREADNLLLKAHEFADDLMQKDELVRKAVDLWPEYRQEEYRQLGLEMSAAVIGNVDHRKWQSMKAAGYTYEAPNSEIPLEEDERVFFTEHAISYLHETVFNINDMDARGLLYLACMYGYRQQYDEMIEVLEKEKQISSIVQDMKNEFMQLPMLHVLLGACGSDQTKIERLRETLSLPQATEQMFCNYITEVYPLNPNFKCGRPIRWVAVKIPDVSGINGALVISISPLYPALEGTVYAFSLDPAGKQEEIVPTDKRVSIEGLYRKLSSSFVLFCSID
jgi:hypothetical protein